MNKEMEIKMLKDRIVLLSSRQSNNQGIIKKLERKIRNLSKEEKIA